jgi:hypothetical protein
MLYIEGPSIRAQSGEGQGRHVPGAKVCSGIQM